MSRPNHYISLFLYIIFLGAFPSCKKDILNTSTSEENRTENQLLKDSVYYYYNLYSLWGDGIVDSPEVIFSFTDTFESTFDVLQALKSTTPFHAGYNSSIDRFSYLEDINGRELQSEFQMDANSGFGLFLSIGAVSNDIAYPIVYFVEGGSSAAAKGISRSDIIMEIDESGDLGIPVTCGSTSCEILDQKRYQAVINILLAAMEQSSMKLKVLHGDDSESEISLVSSHYEVDPIIKDSVFSYSEKNIGYLALSSFEDVSEGHVNLQRLENVFEEFEENQISDLILDLRYNTGGYVTAAEYIADKVINEAGNKSLMYSYVLNDYLLQHHNMVEGSFEDVYFKRNNNLDLKTVYFLVTDITASASELLINVLKPYMNVVIIAENDGTYGKPVGFFKQDILNSATLWVASFKLMNAAGNTDYWDGLEADKKHVTDYVFRDFGDVEEAMLSAAITDALGKTSSQNISARTFRVQQPMKRKLGLVNTVQKKEML